MITRPRASILGMWEAATGGDAAGAVTLPLNLARCGQGIQRDLSYLSLLLLAHSLAKSTQLLSPRLPPSPQL